MNYKLFPMIHDDYYYSLLFSTILFTIIFNNYPIVVHYIVTINYIVVHYQLIHL